MKRGRGFTLVELLVVIVIITTLAGLLLPVLWRARIAGLDAECKNNMQQIGKALMMYRDEYLASGKEMHPHWLADLVPNYMHQKEIILCPRDTSMGAEGGKPNMDGVDQYPELDNPTVADRSSYMYEFNMAADCGWTWYNGGDFTVTLPGMPADGDRYIDLDGNPLSSKWGEVKTAQLRYGDSHINAVTPGEPSALKPEGQWRGYPVTRFPIIRCFWHTDNPNTNSPQIFNLSYQCNYFRSGAKWEETALAP